MPSRPRPTPDSPTWTRSAAPGGTPPGGPRADQAIREHEASTRAVAELLADPDLDVPLDPPADLAGAQVAVEAARKAHDDAVAAYDRAKHKAEQLADLAPQLTARLEELSRWPPRPPRPAGSPTSWPAWARTRCG